MRFTWDPLKNEANLRRRQFDFEFAALIFEGPTLERDDTRRDYGERRVVAVGFADGFALLSYIPIAALKLQKSKGALFPRAEAIDKSEEPMPKNSRKPSRGRANLEYLRQMSDGEIARTSPPELANLPADFWASARPVIPVRKEAISLRVDEDVLAWFRKAGPRYQSRMNAVLRSYVAAMRRGPSGSSARPRR